MRERWECIYSNEKQAGGTLSCYCCAQVLFGFPSHPCGPRVHEYLNRKGTSSKHQSKPYLFNYWPQIWDLQPNSSFWWEAKSARSNACLYSNHVDNMSIKDRPLTAGRPSWTGKKTGYFLVTLHLDGIHKKFFVCWKGIRKQQRNYSKEILFSISLENKRVPGMKKKSPDSVFSHKICYGLILKDTFFCWTHFIFDKCQTKAFFFFFFVKSNPRL